MKAALPLLLGLLVATPAAAHRTSAPSRAELTDELRGINQQLDYARRRIDLTLDADPTSALTLLHRAQVDFFSGDPARAAARLLDLLSRPGFADHAARADALSWLGESLWALGLQRAARQHLREAVDAPKQTPSAFQRRLAAWLERAGPEASTEGLRLLWRRAQLTDQPQNARVRYLFGRAFYRAGALGDAEGAFASVPPGGLPHLRARYFLGVLALRRDDLDAAATAFEEARAAWTAQMAALPAAPLDLDDIDEDGPAREATEIDVPAPADDKAAEHLEALHRLGAVIHLALARLAAAQGEPERAWTLYRRVPPGDPDFEAAMEEAVFVLLQRDAHDRGVRVLDQLVAQQTPGLRAARLALWRAQLMAQGTRYEDAQAAYQALDDEFAGRRAALDAALAAKPDALNDATLAWNAPRDGERAQAVDAELATQTKALAEAAEMARALAALSTDAALPAVRDGRALTIALAEQLVRFDARLSEAEAAAHRESDTADEPHGGGPPASVHDVELLRASATRMRGRLGRFEKQLDRYSRSMRQRLDAVLAAEQPALARLEVRLAAEQAAMGRLAGEMRNTARENLETAAAEAVLGQVEIAWWRKEEVSRQIRAAAQARDAAQQTLSAPESAPTPAPIPDAAPTGEPPPADEPPVDPTNPGGIARLR
ncbi:MAG: hypothetical protein KC620_09630 [Myxococcales bacterium]|nr:hypothetical protein [Myxococcales bacterium]